MNRHISILAVLIVCVYLVSVALAEDPYKIGWLRQIGTSVFDDSSSVTVDTSGNVYISGSTDGNLGGTNAGGRDAYLTKYDGTGNLIWSRQIGTSSTDYGISVAVDHSGDTYISGCTYGSLGNPNAGYSDAFLTKYNNSTGTLIWTRQIGTLSGDVSYSVAVDAFGNAFISGWTQGSLGCPNAGYSDAFLTKYDGTGNLLWSRQIGTSAWDQSLSVAVDALGNAYISGWTDGNLGGTNAGGRDAFLTKYDGTGNLIWSRQIGTSVQDESSSVAVDSSGNIYISGYTHGNLGGTNAGGRDAFLAKYDDSGNIIWSRQIGTSNYDESSSVAVDASGNAYITGYSGGTDTKLSFRDAFLTKYDGTGNLLWSQLIGTPVYDVSAGVAIDCSGNAYISGFTYGSLGGPNAGNYDAFLVKFVVPEPSTLALLYSALLGLGWRVVLVRRRNVP